MEPVYISTRECDREFDDILQPYHDNGNDILYGVLMSLALPPSRPRPTAGSSYGLSPNESLQLVSFNATSTPGQPGIYVLAMQKEKALLAWVARAELEEQLVDESSKSAFIGCLESGELFGKHCPVLKIDHLLKNTPIRRQLDIRGWPISKDDSVLRIAVCSGGCKDFKRFNISILTSNSPIPLYTPTALLHLLIYHHRGSPVNWIVVPPSQKEKLEYSIRNSFDMDPSIATCHQFIAHMSIWITCDILKTWGVDFHEMEQCERQLMVVFPGSYVWGFSTGFAIVEKKHWASHDWMPQDYPYCNMDTSLCNSAEPNTLTVDLPKTDINALKNAALQPQKRRYSKPQKSRVKKQELDEPGDNIDIDAEDPKVIKITPAIASKMMSSSAKHHQQQNNIRTWSSANTSSAPYPASTLRKSSNDISLPCLDEDSTKKRVPITFTIKARNSTITSALPASPSNAMPSSASEIDFIPTPVETYTFNNPAVENNLLKKQLATIAKERDLLWEKNRFLQGRIERREERIGVLESELAKMENKDDTDGDDHEGCESETDVDDGDIYMDRPAKEVAEDDSWSDAEMAPGFGEPGGAGSDSDDEIMHSP